MLAWDWQVDRLVPSREMHNHPKLKQRIGPEGVARWKREMGARETFVAEAFMGSHLSRLGYERRYNSPVWQPAFALTRWYCRTVLPGVDFSVRAARFLRKRLPLRQRPTGCADRSTK